MASADTLSPSQKNLTEVVQRLEQQLSARAQAAGVFRILLTFAGLVFLVLLGIFLVGGSTDAPAMAAVAAVGCVLWTLIYAQIAEVQTETTPTQTQPGSLRPRTTVMLQTSRGMVNRYRYYMWRYLVGFLAVLLGIFTFVLILQQYGLLEEGLVIILFTALFPFSYLAYAVFQRPVRVESLRRDFDLLDEPWDEGLYEQSQGFWNFALHIVIAMLATFIGAIVFIFPIFNGDVAIAGIALEAQVIHAIGLGFIGAYLFSAQLIYRRYTTFDLQPYVYLYCALTILAGMVLNYALFQALFATASASAVPEVSNLGAGLLHVLSLAIGFFPLLTIQWLTRIAYSAMRQDQRRADLMGLDLIDGISSLHEVRLRDHGIDNIQNLATVDIPKLMINTRFGAQQVIDWIDQAILYLHLEPGEIASFRTAKIRTVTDFCDAWEKHELPVAAPDAPAGNALAIIPVNNGSADWKAPLGVVDSRLDMLYSTVTTGANFQRVRNYWRKTRVRAEQEYILGEYYVLLMDVYQAPDTKDDIYWLPRRRRANEYLQKLDEKIAPSHGVAKAALARLEYRGFLTDPDNNMNCLQAAIDHYSDALTANVQSNRDIISRLKMMVEKLSDLAGKEAGKALLAEATGRTQELERAESFYKHAKEISRSFYGNDTPNFGQILNLIDFYSSAKFDLDAGLVEVSEAWACLRMLAATPATVRLVDLQHSRLRAAIYKLAAAAEVQAQNLASRTPLLPEDDEQRIRILDKVRALYQNAIEEAQEYADNHLDLGYTWHLAEFENRQRYLTSALDWTNRALEACTVQDNPQYAQKFNSLRTDIQTALQRPADAPAA